MPCGVVRIMVVAEVYIKKEIMVRKRMPCEKRKKEGKEKKKEEIIFWVRTFHQQEPEGFLWYE